MFVEYKKRSAYAITTDLYIALKQTVLTHTHTTTIALQKHMNTHTQTNRQRRRLARAMKEKGLCHKTAKNKNEKWWKSVDNNNNNSYNKMTQ